MESPMRGLRGGAGGLVEAAPLEGASFAAEVGAGGRAGGVVAGADVVSLPGVDSVSDMGRSSHGARAGTCEDGAIRRVGRRDPPSILVVWSSAPTGDPGGAACDVWM